VTLFAYIARVRGDTPTAYLRHSFTNTRATFLTIKALTYVPDKFVMTSGNESAAKTIVLISAMFCLVVRVYWRHVLSGCAC
jgi:hypothetical protein